MLRILWTEYVNKKKSIFKKTKTKSKCILTLETCYHSLYVFFRSNRYKQNSRHSIDVYACASNEAIVSAENEISETSLISNQSVKFTFTFDALLRLPPQLWVK